MIGGYPWKACRRTVANQLWIVQFTVRDAGHRHGRIGERAGRRAFQAER